MRVKISTNPPLPPLRAWFPLHDHAATPTISSFKYLLCTSLPAFRDTAPSSLRLSIDGFELLDNSELTIIRDGDLISVDVRDVLFEDVTAQGRLKQAVDPSVSHATQTRLESAASRKRKRRMTTPSSSSAESTASESESESETSDSESTSDSDGSSVSSLRKAELPQVHARERAQATPHPATFVPPGYGKPQTRSRNLRRRLKRTHEREAAGVSGGGPVSGANATVPGEDTLVQAITAVPDASGDTHTVPTLMSLSLRNKNKAKNFKSLMDRPLPPKIIFGDEEDPSTSGAQMPSTQALPRLIAPSLRSSLPPNLFVTSVDVEAGLHREKKKRKMRDEYGDELVSADVTLDYGDGPEVDVDRLESMANKQWATLEKPRRERQVVGGTLVGYKALGIDPVTNTPGRVLTVGRVVSCDGEGMIVRPLRALSFHWPAEEAAEAEEHAWDEIDDGDWRLLE